MYRAVTFAALRRGLDPSDDDDVAEVSEALDLRGRRRRGDRRRRRRHGRDPWARGHLGRQRGRRQQPGRAPNWSAASGSGWPSVAGESSKDATSARSCSPTRALKLYVTASPRVRAERRVAEIGGNVDEVEASIIERDRKDSTRADSPLHASVRRGGRRHEWHVDRRGRRAPAGAGAVSGEPKPVGPAIPGADRIVVRRVPHGDLRVHPRRSPG